MNTKYNSNFFSGAIFSGILMLVLFGISASNVMAVKITVKKDVCNSIGSNNTCNGQNNELDGSSVDFSVTPGVGAAASSIITVPIANGAGQATLDGFATQTTYTVCELDVDPRFDAVPQPDGSTGGSGQTSAGDCITFTTGNGNGANVNAQFINLRLALVPTAATAMIAGRVIIDNGFVRGSSRLFVTVLNTTTLETRIALTNRLGYYEFNDLPVGDTYILSVRGKGLNFTPQTISLTEDSALDMRGITIEDSGSKGRRR